MWAKAQATLCLRSDLDGLRSNAILRTGVADLHRSLQVPERCLNAPQECLEDEDTYVVLSVPTTFTSNSDQAVLDLGFQRRRVIATADVTFKQVRIQGLVTDVTPFFFFFLWHSDAKLVCDQCIMEHSCAGTDATFFLESMRLVRSTLLKAAAWCCQLNATLPHKFSESAEFNL